MNPTTYESVTMDDKLPMRIIHLDASDKKSPVTMMYPNANMDHVHFIPPHWHRSIEFTFVVKGSMRLRLGEDVRIVGPHEFLLVNSGDIHEMSNVPGHDIEVICFIISYDYLREIEPDFAAMRFDITRNMRSYPELESLFRGILALHYDEDPLSHLLIRSKLDQILYYLFRDYQIDSSENHVEKHLTQQRADKIILEYVHEHFRESLSLKDLADHFHMSREHFSRSFKESFGKPFLEYVMDYRIYRAFPDIVHSNRSIEAISRDFGFVSSKALILQFKNRYQMAPYAYRKRYKVIIMDHNDAEFMSHTLVNINK